MFHYEGDAQTTALLNEVVQALKQGLGADLIAVVLFGSRARGEAHPDSDWDLLVIAENLPDSPWRRQQKILTLLPPQWQHQVNILTFTPGEWFARVTPLALDIALDGIVLYDGSQESLRARLAALRKQLSDLGLERHTVENSWVWLWRDQPRHHWQLEWEK